MLQRICEWRKRSFRAVILVLSWSSHINQGRLLLNFFIKIITFLSHCFFFFFLLLPFSSRWYKEKVPTAVDSENQEPKNVHIGTKCQKGNPQTHSYLLCFNRFPPLQYRLGFNPFWRPLKFLLHFPVEYSSILALYVLLC